MPFPALYKDISVSPDTDDFFIDTLEFHHTAFSAPERIVNKPQDYTLTLEATAPEDASTAVQFTSCPYDMRKPKKGDQGQQTLTIIIPNVDRRLTSQMDRARAVGGPITCYWRTYAFSQLTAPLIDPPPSFEVKAGQINVFEIQLQASFFDFLNDKFPKVIYTSEFAPGLTR